MVRQVLIAITFLVFLSSCSTFKPLNFTSNKQVSTSLVPGTTQPTKFIEEIAVTPKGSTDKTAIKPEVKPTAATKGLDKVETPALKQESDEIARILASRHAVVEDASSVQLKYAVLLNTEVEALPTKTL